MPKTSFINVQFSNRPVQGFYPIHNFVKSWVFQSEEEANLADAAARVAEINGMSNNDIMQLFPAILRILKSNSEWTK